MNVSMQDLGLVEVNDLVKVAGQWFTVTKVSAILYHDHCAITLEGTTKDGRQVIYRGDSLDQVRVNL